MTALITGATSGLGLELAVRDVRLLLQGREAGRPAEVGAAQTWTRYAPWRRPSPR